MKLNKKLLAAAVAATALSFSISSFAAISAQEAARLGKDLTPIGAEKAGNASGTIPAWNGGMTTALPGYKAGGHHPDPFPNEKPQLTITAANMDKYADQLSEGQKALLKQYPQFKMNVYKTHRTAALPKRIYEATKKNATNAKLIDDGNSVTGARAGVPFPIPQDGNEALWNHMLRFQGVMKTFPEGNEAVVYNSGRKVRWTFSNDIYLPYYDENVSKKDRNIAFKYASTMISPSRAAGEGILALESLKPTTSPRKAWIYDPGERRVRRAPNLAFDTPDRAVSVIDDYDVYSGSLERFDMKLIGKQEMYVPYNNNRLNHGSHSRDEVETSPTINPELTRYELHRVWVVEGSLKDNARHIYSKRRMYLDEDTWAMLVHDKFDGNGDLWRVGMTFPIIAPEIPVVAGGINVSYDLKVGAYHTINGTNGHKKGTSFDAKPPKSSFYSPAALRRRGK